MKRKEIIESATGFEAAFAIYSFYSVVHVAVQHLRVAHFEVCVLVI